MPPEVNVATNPLIVYAMVAVFVGVIALALVFARPRRDLGAVKRSEVPDHAPGGQPWMPGGDIFGKEPQPEPELPAAVDPWQPAVDPWQRPAADQWPAADPWQAVPPAAPPATPTPGASQPAVHDPWSTGATANAEPQPRWDKR
jgi:hypothetical protein